MTQEEKAKAYDEAIIKAKALYGQPFVDNTLLETIFHELKESEDEKVRKALIEMVHDFTGDSLWVDYNIHKEEALAWLEKQGESYTKKDVDNAYIEGMASAKHELEKQYEQKETPCDKCNKEQPSHSCQDITALGRCAIEKQGEQKPFDYENATIVQKDFAPKSAMEAINEEKVDNANKIEPKFKVGDFIVNDYCMGEVIALTDDAYLLDTGQGITFSCEHNAHLWTIQDAKDGDMLATSAGAFIYNGNNGGGSCPGCYCGINTLGNFKTGVKDHWTGKKVYPATEEQRDLLFAKMKEAGYEWEEGDKELKLLITNGGDFESENCEQNPACSEDETSIAIKDSKAYRIGFADGEAHAKEEMQSSYSEAMYNFVNKWKSGKFGEVSLQKALSTKFNDYFNSVLDKSKELEARP